MPYVYQSGRKDKANFVKTKNKWFFLKKNFV